MALIVAGYDQSAGAGVLSDIKTLEALGVYGYAVCTGLTFQHERRISRVRWFSLEDITEQIDLCFESGMFSYVKMGITPSMTLAGAVIDHLRRLNPELRVVLDPVIRASSGNDFWSKFDREEWETLARKCYLITPNRQEIEFLYPGEDIEERCAALTSRKGCHVYLKGGDDPVNAGRDFLWSDGEAEVLDAPAGRFSPKHGSGCVLSSAITANLALGYGLREAAVRAKRYIEKFLASNETLLGWH